VHFDLLRGGFPQAFRSVQASTIRARTKLYYDPSPPDYDPSLAFAEGTISGITFD
jgi:hypothetical protein